MTDLYEYAPGWSSDPAGRCRPGMVALTKHLVDNFPHAVNLGCYSNRAKTSGSTPSLHRDGRAIDVGWLDGNTLYLDEREEAYEFLIANAAALGIQMILNYRNGSYGGTRWRLPYRAGDIQAGRGTWSSAGHWLHIERTNAGADDARSVDEILGATAPATTPPQTTPTTPAVTPATSSETCTVNLNLPVVKKDAAPEAAVEQVQTMLNLKAGESLDVDGSYGPNTRKAVNQFQAYLGLEVDEVVGADTWGMLLAVWV